MLEGMLSDIFRCFLAALKLFDPVDDTSKNPSAVSVLRESKEFQDTIPHRFGLLGQKSAL